MSSAPSGWLEPKTNWNSADVPLPTDFNRIEGDLQAVELGSRTLDQSMTPSGNSGTLRQILSWLANRIRAITGESNWWSNPGTTLAAAAQHMAATSGVHGATSSATANRLIIRDGNGRAKVAAPSASDDIATKGYVDNLIASRINKGSYSGNGASNRPINVGFRPSYVLIISRYTDTGSNPERLDRLERWDGLPYTIIARGRWDGTFVPGTGSATMGPLTSDISITDTGFTVSFDANRSGRTYYWLAMG